MKISIRKASKDNTKTYPLKLIKAALVEEFLHLDG